jgi:hypothetical protein
MPIFSYYKALNCFMLITRWHLNKKLTMTLPTHLQKKTFRLIPFWTPVNSLETLPLKPLFLKAVTVVAEDDSMRAAGENCSPLTLI